MSRYFHGGQQLHSFFEGWYFKHQSGEHTLILIPAFHRDERGEKSATLQVILDENSWQFSFTPAEFEADSGRLHVRVGQNVFSEKGCRLHLDAPGLALRGHLRYGSFHAPKRSFMGPVGRLPLPCFHEVLSLFHSLRGLITVNGELWDFSGGLGYLEKDWGHSFPDSYLWLQCGWQDDAAGRASVMLAVAGLGTKKHPLTACSSLILCAGKQYRLSTYQGAQLLRCGGRRIALRQGPWLLQVILPQEEHGQEGSALLLAPREGTMKRTIREYSRCPMRCQLYRGGQRILDVEKEGGSLEKVPVPAFRY